MLSSLGCWCSCCWRCCDPGAMGHAVWGAGAGFGGAVFGSAGQVPPDAGDVRAHFCEIGGGAFLRE